MVSFHIVPVIVYLIVRVISYTFRFKRENPAFRSSHTLRLWHAQPIKDEQRTETHADEFIQLSQYPVVRIQQDTGHL